MWTTVLQYLNSFRNADNQVLSAKSELFEKVKVYITLVQKPYLEKT